MPRFAGTVVFRSGWSDDRERFDPGDRPLETQFAQIAFLNQVQLENGRFPIRETTALALDKV